MLASYIEILGAWSNLWKDADYFFITKSLPRNIAIGNIFKVGGGIHEKINSAEEHQKQ